MKSTMKTFWFRKFLDKISELKTSHKANLHLFKLSYAKQVEELQEIIGNMSSSLNEISTEKISQKLKFEKVMLRNKQKYQALK
mmetsp:Transcript_43463/g.51160  ORF Transcript_43463/g.51160 Transcript_43463/m.51160 type:complete len:83 (-) Transcript_43463:938-1186(-)